jgi:transcriptional regulator with XRE-family HTH domain/anti-sigma regulatory factor (Ser/Thr protein kinase)
MSTAEVVPLGERLKHRREELGLSQAQAARELDVARTAYRLWEMEAAKPAPDRWRLIASWLGVSIATMLLAEELIDESEAAAAGDFFAQERATLDTQTLRGVVTDAESVRLGHALDRVQASIRTARAPGSKPAEFRKEFASDPRAPSIARSALLITAAGLPVPIVEDAELLISELVTNSVQHAGGDLIRIHITIANSVLRVEVADDSPRPARPRTPGDDGGWGLNIVMELATRWGSGREHGKNVNWFELDL